MKIQEKEIININLSEIYQIRLSVISLFVISVLISMGCGNSNAHKTADNDQPIDKVVDTIQIEGNHELLVMEISDTQSIGLYKKWIRESARDLEIIHDTTRFFENDSGVVLNLSNHNQYAMTNSISGDTSSDVYSITKYTCRGYIRDLNAWLIKDVGEFSGTCEGGLDILVNSYTGEEVDISGDPVISPGGSYFYTFENTALSGFYLKLYKFEDNRVTVMDYESDNPFEHWVTSECSSVEGWIDNHSLLIRIDCNDDQSSSKYLKIIIQDVA